MRIIRIRTTLCLVFLFRLILLSGQEISLEGQVLIHNSGVELGEIKGVENAFISADFSSPTSTDTKGRFKLVFSEVLFGTGVGIKAEKSGWDIVNKRELLDITIGRISPVRIYLAKKGAIAKARAELEQISLEALIARHQRLISELKKDNEESQRIIQELEQQLNKNIKDRFEAERILNEQLKNNRKRLPEISLDLVKVNLDFASKMYRTAFQHFKNGEIEKTIEALNEAILDQQAKEAEDLLLMTRTHLNNLDTASIAYQKQLENLIESALLVGQVQYKDQKYQEASLTLASAAQDLPRLKSGKGQEGIRLITKAAQWYLQNGEYQGAYYYFLRAFKEQGYDSIEKMKSNPKWDGEIFLLQTVINLFN